MKSHSSKPSPDNDIIAAMGKLLTDPSLRDEFFRSPNQVASRLGLVGEELEIVTSLDPANLEIQAETLLKKRWHEVTKLLPDTIAEMGEECEELFRHYASKSWPQGHRRHALDAKGFLEYLEHNQLGQGDSAEARRVRRLASRRFF